MTISSTPSEVSYDGDDISVSFPIPFVFDTSADLKIIQTDADGNPVVLSSGFSIAGGDGSTGTLTLDTALPSDEFLTILDDPERNQSIDYIANDSFPAESAESGFDRGVRISKRVYELILKSIRVADGDPAAGSGMELGSVDNRKGKYLFFNAITGAIEYAIALATETLSQSIIAQFLNPQTSAEAAAGFTPTNYLYTEGDVRRAGADPTGAVDSTSAIQATIDIFTSGSGLVRMPGRAYKVTSTITIDQHRIHIRGDGLHSTTINFVPTGEDILFFFGKGGEGSGDSGTIVQCSIGDMYIKSTDTTFKKTAIEIKDVSQFQAHNIAIGPTGSWTGATSIGLRTRGRDAGYFSDLDIEADVPISIGNNTGAAGALICADHFNFNNLLLIASDPNPCVLVEPGVALTNTSFDGSQAWVHGKYGLFWDNTAQAAAGASFNVTFRNVRWEQGDDATGWAFYIVYGATSTLNSVRWENIYTGDEAQGWYLRKVVRATLEDCSYISTTRVALDIDDAVTTESVSIRNCFWQTGCTANIAADYRLHYNLSTNNTSPLPRTGEYSVKINNEDKSEIVQAFTNTLTALESGRTYFLDLAAGGSTVLPAPELGLSYKFIVTTAPTTAYTIDTNGGDNIMYGTYIDIVGELVYFSAQDILSFVASTSVIGDRVKVESDGTNWYCKAISGADGGITTGQT